MISISQSVLRAQIKCRSVNTVQRHTDSQDCLVFQAELAFLAASRWAQRNGKKSLNYYSRSFVRNQNCPADWKSIFSHSSSFQNTNNNNWSSEAFQVIFIHQPPLKYKASSCLSGQLGWAQSETQGARNLILNFPNLIEMAQAMINNSLLYYWYDASDYHSVWIIDLPRGATCPFLKQRKFDQRVAV